MGYYFEKAKTRESMNTEQLERYEAFRSSDSTFPIPQELHDRIEFIKKYIGPITSGEIVAALEELIQDAIVTWILAGENPQKVQWTHPDDIATPPPTEEEKQENRKRWEETVARWEEENKHKQAELELWKREHRIERWKQIGAFFQRLLGR